MTARGAIVVTMTVVTEDDTEATRAGEVMFRAATGLALDGIGCGLTIGRVEEDPAETEVPPHD